MRRSRIKSVRMIVKLLLTNVRRSFSGYRKTRKLRKKILMGNRRKSKEYVIQLLLNYIKELAVCLAVCLVVCLEACLMLVLLKEVPDQQLKKLIKSQIFQSNLISWTSRYYDVKLHCDLLKTLFTLKKANFPTLHMNDLYIAFLDYYC